MKFLHPVPDVFTPKKSVHADQPRKDMNPSTCTPPDSKVIFSLAHTRRFRTNLSVFLFFASIFGIRIEQFLCLLYFALRRYKWQSIF